jgi:predicted trehalose synthase
VPPAPARGWLLDLFTIEKALYECLYELRHRPEMFWVPRSFLEGLE